MLYSGNSIANLTVLISLIIFSCANAKATLKPGEPGIFDKDFNIIKLSYFFIKFRR